MTKSISVRAIEEGDRDDIAELAMSFMGSTRVARLGRVDDVSILPGYLALEEGKVVGVLSYLVEEKTCELVFLEVVRQWAGIGSRLMAIFTEWAEVQPFDRIILVTTNDNIDALRFYQRRGWRLAEVRAGAVEHARKHLKPGIPETGTYGIPIRDEIVLELSGERP